MTGIYRSCFHTLSLSSIHYIEGRCILEEYGRDVITDVWRKLEQTHKQWKHLTYLLNTFSPFPLYLYFS